MDLLSSLTVPDFNILITQNDYIISSSKTQTVNYKLKITVTGNNYQSADTTLSFEKSCPTGTKALTAEQINQIQNLNDNQKQFPNLFCTCETGTMNADGICSSNSCPGNSTYYSSPPSNIGEATNVNGCYCPANQYWDGENCTNCSAGCDNCIKSSNYDYFLCTKCKNQYYGVGGNVNGHYDMICKPCPLNATCNNNITCDPEYYITYDYNLNAECRPCGTGCQTCSSNSGSCEHCKPGYLLQGTYSINICKACPVGCATCFSYYFGDYCLDCMEGFVKKPIRLSGVDVYECIQQTACPETSTYYLSPTSNIGGVTNVNNCYCPTNQYWNGATCSSCPVNSTYYSNPPNNIGGAAIANNCYCPTNQYWNGTTCSSCPDNSTYYANPPSNIGGVTNVNNCYCPTNQYWNGNSCSSCPDGCIGCSSSSVCLGCKAGYYSSKSFNFFNYTYSNTCNICPSNATCANSSIQCNVGYYLNNEQCLPCKVGCKECITSEICSSCINGYFLDVRYSYYSYDLSLIEVKDICSECSIGCTACSSRNSCSACSSEYYLDGAVCHLPCLGGSHYSAINLTNRANPIAHCYCETDQYWNGNSCSICPGGSKYYSTPPANIGGTAVANNCYCPANQVFKDDTCSSCTGNTYFVNNTSACGICDPSCATCSSSSSCTSCISGYNLNGSSCVINCPSNAVCQNGQITCNAGYFLDGSNCSSCPSGCATCSSGSSCTSCNSGTFLSNSECTACNSICLTCSDNARNCTSCPAGATLIKHLGIDVKASCLNSPVDISCGGNSTCNLCAKGLSLLAHNNTCVDSCPSDTTTFNNFLIYSRTYGMWFNKSDFICLKNCPSGQITAIYSLSVVNDNSNLHLYSSCIASCPYPLTEGLCLTYLWERF